MVDLDAMTLSNSLEPGRLQYCEISITVVVTENYYLKLFPASFIKNAIDGEEEFPPADGPALVGGTHAEERVDKTSTRLRI